MIITYLSAIIPTLEHNIIILLVTRQCAMWSRCMIPSDTQDVIATVIVGECLGDIKVHWVLPYLYFLASTFTLQTFCLPNYVKL